MSYFKPFPLKKYDIEKDGNFKTVTDLMKRVGIRGDLEKIIPSYYKDPILNDVRPELLSYNLYQSVKFHWVLLLLNKVVDPYYDWLISGNALDEVISSMYPNYNLLLDTDHFQEPSYNQSGPTFFISGEIIYQGPNSNIANATATGTVIKFDSTIKQIIYKQISGTFVVDETKNVFGKDSLVVGKVESATSEREGVHHYASSAPEEVGFVVDRDYVVTYGTTNYSSEAVMNADYMDSINEDNRNISVLKGSYLIAFEKEFKDKIGG